MGFDVALITRRSGLALQHRAKELGITRIVQGSQDKAQALTRLLAETGLTAEQIAYVGDDWPDLPALRRVGLPIAVGDADERVKAAAMVVTTAAGGCGAVREAIEAILTAQGLMEKTVGMYEVR
jgi:3-deoxy-D-manno-octulosonate 8-phosphate phosphatase (KDO 8-P phosphatase)